MVARGVLLMGKKKKIKFHHKPKQIKYCIGYINPNSDEFHNKNEERTLKLQIQYLYSIGYSADDIKILCNFEWEYLGVKSIIMNNSFLPKGIKRTAVKALVIKEVLNRDMVKDNEIWWLHDLDLFLVNDLESTPIIQSMFKKSIGMSLCRRNKAYSTASIFFTKDFKCYANEWVEIILKSKKCEEDCINRLIKRDYYFHKSLATLNMTYNFRIKGNNKVSNFEKRTYSKICALHHGKASILKQYNRYALGNNPIKKKIFSPKLAKIYKDYLEDKGVL